ncbi:MAG: hypothetical protein IJA78_00945 [Clostridia bacterium]|nr:hypothetical protein [Clostridia bacterium]MBQ3482723.1 hypothetical protein [Clostridia bacterium]
MKKIRILSLILALFMMAALLVACKKDEDPNAGSAPVAETTLTLIDKGAAKYTIVHDYEVGYEVREAINTLVQAIKANHNADVVVKECFNDREVPSDVPEDNEILVGMTNREESRDALKDLRSNDWVMEVRGSRLVLGSSADAGTVAAIFEFMNAFVYEQGNRNIVREYNMGDTSIELPSLVFGTANNTSGKGTYSYNPNALIADARVDSYVIIYTKNGELADESKSFADELRTHISRETGYELDVYKDTRCWGDFEILIGDTVRTDAGLCADIDDNEYLIKVTKRTVKYDDGSEHEGAQVLVLFGKNAKDAALNAFKKEFMPSSQTPIDLNIADGFTLKGTV